MPLRQTIHGGECPLDKFSIDISAGAGCYTMDPVEVCLSCNFSDNLSEGFDLEKICHSPPDMDRKEYDKLRGQYASSGSKLTKAGFLEFVKENYRK